MSEIIDNFWKRNGTLNDMYDVASAASSAQKSEGVSRFGAIGALVKAIMSFFALKEVKIWLDVENYAVLCDMRIRDER